jgi:transcriptional regulator with XRE-family HTH domain/tetratricopeptide (TPR) repeat protein
LGDARRPNELLRRARILRGWSQQRVADQINDLLGSARADRELVYRWETGKRTPGPYYRERLCIVFAMTAEELGLVELVVAEPASTARTVTDDRTLSGTGQTVESLAGEPLPESVNLLVRQLWGDDVNRRAVLQLIGSLAAGTALDRVPAQPTAVVPAGHAREVAEHLTRAFPELSTADWLLGPHHVLGTVGGHLGLVQQLLPNVAGAKRVQLLNVGARYAEFASWLNQDSGNARGATHWADRAMEWAQEAGNRLMVSYVLVRKSHQAAATRDSSRTIGLAQTALRDRRWLPSRSQAVALQQEAFGHALAGNEVACQRALDTAVRHAERSKQAGDEGPGRYCTPAYVEIQRAATWIELGRPERAIDLFEASLTKLPSVHRRDRGVYLARLASAYAISGNPEISTRKGWEALTVAQATGSRRITTELGQLRTRLAPWRSKREVDQFLKELQAA